MPQIGATPHHKLDGQVGQVKLWLPTWQPSPQEVPSGVFFYGNRGLKEGLVLLKGMKDISQRLVPLFFFFTKTILDVAIGCWCWEHMPPLPLAPFSTLVFPSSSTSLSRGKKKLKKQACELPVDNIPAASFVIPPLPPHSRPLEEKEEKA